jgi:hypothetical protein
MLRSALGVTFLAFAVPLPVAAQEGGIGGANDSVSGYRCVDRSCTTLRLPDANCLCQKQNPGETRLSRLHLKCSTKQGGAWVACPVKPRYGISVD